MVKAGILHSQSALHASENDNQNHSDYTTYIMALLHMYIVQ